MALKKVFLFSVLAALIICAGKPFPSGAADTTTPANESHNADVPRVAHDPRWGVLNDVAGTRWALEGRGEHYIVSFTWAVPGEVLEEEWRGAGSLLPVRGFATRMEWDARRQEIRARGTEGTTARWSGQVAADGSVEFRATSLLARGHVYRFAWQDDTLFFVEGGVSGLVKAPFKTMPMIRLDAQAEARYVAEVNAAQAIVVRQQRQRDMERSAQWSQTMGMIDGALDAGLAVVHEQRAQTQDQGVRLPPPEGSSIAPASSRPNANPGASVNEPPVNPGTVFIDSGAGQYTAIGGPGTGSWEDTGSRSPNGQASTRDDPSTCVSAPVTSTHRCDTLSGYKARISNNCAAPVDVRVCFMTANGWDCQASYGIASGGSWEPGWCHANTGETFHSSRYSDSRERLESP